MADLTNRNGALRRAAIGLLAVIGLVGSPALIAITAGAAPAGAAASTATVTRTVSYGCAARIPTLTYTITLPLTMTDSVTAPTSATPGQSVTLTGVQTSVTFPGYITGLLAEFGVTSVSASVTEIDTDATGATPAIMNDLTTAYQVGPFTVVATTPITVSVPVPSATVGPFTVGSHGPVNFGPGEIKATIYANGNSFSTSATAICTPKATGSTTTFASVGVESPSIVSTSLAEGSQFGAYSASLEGQNGRDPYTWSVTGGMLPPGLSLDGTTGVISGTPVTMGTWSFTATLTDANGQSASAPVTITIGAPSLSNTNTVTYSYTCTVSALGFSLPLNLTVTDTADGPVTAYPGSSIGLAGVQSSTTIPGYLLNELYYFGVNSASGTITTSDLTATNASPNSMNVLSGPDNIGTYELAGTSQTVTLVTPGTPASPTGWTAGTSGPIEIYPGGISGNLSVDLNFGGGSFTLNVPLSCTAPSTDVTPLLTIPVEPFTVSTTSLPGGTVGLPYSNTLAGSGGSLPDTWTVTSGSLPAGLVLNTDGAVTGTPTVSGTSTFTVSAIDAQHQVASGTVSITIGTASTTSSAGAPGCSTTTVGSPSETSGYWLAGANGAVYSCGNAAFDGSLTSMSVKPSSPIVGLESTSDGKGYWLVAADGGIFAFGDASFYGSMGGKSLNAPVIGMAVTAGGGYYEVASDGGIFAFGPGTTFSGSMGGKSLDAPIVGMSVVSAGGYYEVASDGGIFAFGTGTPFDGSMGGKSLNKPIVGMAVNSTGGYYEVASDGGIFAFSSAFHGSTGCMSLAKPISAIVTSPNTTNAGSGTACGYATTQSPGGYQFVAADGGVFSFGNAAFDGSLAGDNITDIVGMSIS